MPEQIIFQDFSAGWIPSDDASNGRKNGFLRFDNCELDDNGAITLIGGTSVLRSGYTQNWHSMFSIIINGVRHDYGADVAGQVYRDSTNILAAGDPVGDTQIAAFSAAFDFVLICSGALRKKDNGTSAFNLGVKPPTVAPGLSIFYDNAPQTKFATLLTDIMSPLLLGSFAVLGGYYVQMTANADGIAVIQTFDTTPTPKNLNTMVGASGIPSNATDQDFITLSGYIPDPFGKALQFDVLLENPNGAGDEVGNFYRYIIDDLATAAEYSAQGVFTVKMRRKDFQRVGSGGHAWTQVWGFRLTFNGDANEKINIFGTSVADHIFSMVGGDKTQQGTYQYLQVNVVNNGSYLGKSPIGPISGAVDIDMMQMFVVPQNPNVANPDGQANEAWIYRRGGLLNDWYRVMVFDSTTGFTSGYDTMSDVDAIELGIKLNQNFISVADIPGHIVSIVGPMEGRWIYFNDDTAYLSEINNPDLVDASTAIKLTGSKTEKVLWAKQVGNKTILVGTTFDVYSFTGTFITQPDFIVDIFYDGFGTEYPPITYDATEASNGVFYLAKDGWRLMGSDGENKNLITPSLDVLYRGKARFGYNPPNLKFMPGNVRFPVVVAKNKLWCFISKMNRCEVYDFTRGYWRTFSNYGLGDITAAYSTQDGRILCFFVDNKLREIDTVDKLIDGTYRNVVSLLSPIFHNNSPYQRKDSYTFNMRFYTGAQVSGAGLNVGITTDHGTSVMISKGIPQFSTTFVEELVLDMADFPTLRTAKTYQILIDGPVSDLKITSFGISYDLHPLPLTFLRIQDTNYGTAARKRISSIPFQIDTLGNNVNFRPIIDGAPQFDMTVVSTRKQTFDYQFQLNGTGMDIDFGVDYGYEIDSTNNIPFEFYGFTEIKNIEILPEASKTLVIPVTNFGTPNKKRVRVWPFVIDPLGGIVNFVPIVDGVSLPQLNHTFDHEGKRTVFVHYTEDVFGVDYSGIMTGSGPFELWKVEQPTVVEVLPIEKRFDQVGPEELFKLGKILEFEIRLLPFGNLIPYRFFYNDDSELHGDIEVVSGKEATYFVKVPKGTTMNVVRIEIGPTDFDFHRHYLRLKVNRSGRDTESEWVTLG